MRQVVDTDRMPEPLTVHVDEEDADTALKAAEEDIPDRYTDEISYQLSVVLPPVDAYDAIVETAATRPSVYTVVMGMDTDSDHPDRHTEQTAPDYDLGPTDAFTATVDRIDTAIDDTPYTLDHWRASLARTAYSREDAVGALSSLEVPVTARVDADLDDDPATDSSILVGWFRTAPMDPSLQFGYRAFPSRETDELWEQIDADEHPVDTLLSYLDGEAQDVLNEHAIARDELDALRTLEDSLYRHGVL